VFAPSVMGWNSSSCLASMASTRADNSVKAALSCAHVQATFGEVAMPSNGCGALPHNCRCPGIFRAGIQSLQRGQTAQAQKAQCPTAPKWQGHRHIASASTASKTNQFHTRMSLLDSGNGELIGVCGIMLRPTAKSDRARECHRLVVLRTTSCN